MEGLNSDLELEGSTAPQAQPRIGQWGPKYTPTSRFKKWQRALIWVGFVLFSVLLICYCYVLYRLLNGNK